MKGTLNFLFTIQLLLLGVEILTSFPTHLFSLFSQHEHQLLQAMKFKSFQFIHPLLSHPLKQLPRNSWTLVSSHGFLPPTKSRDSSFHQAGELGSLPHHIFDIHILPLLFSTHPLIKFPAFLHHKDILQSLSGSREMGSTSGDGSWSPEVN